MANLQDLSTFSSRRSALNRALTIYEQQIKELAAGSSRARALWDLVQRLQAFGGDHFDYFYNGFNDGSLAYSANYHPQHVLNVVLFQMADDMEAIYQAATDDQMAADNAAIRQALQTADHLIAEALKPAARLGLQETTAIAYFQRAASIRVTPYDEKMALIGIPFTCLEVPQDYLAIPHEVGHYLFWNGRLQGKPLWVKVREELDATDLPDWTKAWAEEVFCDVYGCLVAGPLIALDFQDLQLLEPGSHFDKNEGDHPAPILRPDAYTRTLQRGNRAQWAARLQSHWQGHLTEKGAPAHLLLALSDLAGLPTDQVTGSMDTLGYFSLPLNDARQKLEQMTDIIYDLLANQALNFSDSWWATQAGDQTSLADLYPFFAGQLAALQQTLPDGVSTPEGTPTACDTHNLWANWKRQLDQVAPLLSSQVDPDEPDWFGVWLADGWATRGPQGAWP